MSQLMDADHSYKGESQQPVTLKPQVGVNEHAQRRRPQADPQTVEATPGNDEAREGVVAMRLHPIAGRDRRQAGRRWRASWRGRIAWCPFGGEIAIIIRRWICRWMFHAIRVCRPARRYVMLFRIHSDRH